MPACHRSEVAPKAFARPVIPKRKKTKKTKTRTRTNCRKRRNRRKRDFLKRRMNYVLKMPTKNLARVPLG